MYLEYKYIEVYFYLDNYFYMVQEYFLFLVVASNYLPHLPQGFLYPKQIWS